MHQVCADEISRRIELSMTTKEGRAKITTVCKVVPLSYKRNVCLEEWDNLGNALS